MWSTSASAPPKIIILGLIMFLSSSHAQATVYGWKGEGGAWLLTNDPEAVPDAYRASAQRFTSKLAGRNTAVPVESAPPTEQVSTLVNLQRNAYERGLAQGLHTAERQAALAGELARTILAAAPRTPPLRIIIQQPGPIIVRAVTPSYYPEPFYGFIGQYGLPYWGGFYPFSYAYGFRHGRLIPHSHFFPGRTRGRRFGVYFPYGHSSHHGFLFGHGFVVR